MSIFISQKPMIVKTKIPRTPAELRAYLAFHRISITAVARAYGGDHSWISKLLNEDRKASEEVWKKLRRAIAEAMEEKG